MTDVVVKDNFGAEIEIDDNVTITGGDWSNLNIRETGKTNKIHLKWSIDDLEPGDNATLVLNISTDNNTAKVPKQEYTTGGNYDLNSGATLKFKLDCPDDSPVESIPLQPHHLLRYSNSASAAPQINCTLQIAVVAKAAWWAAMC